MRYDSVVIGSGVSGLCSALVLARQGKKVAIVEQNRRIAPLLSRFEREGFCFDTGFHYCGGLHEEGDYRVFFRFLGLDDLFQEAVPMNPEGYDTLTWTDGTELRIPSGLENTRAAFQEAFPDSAQAVGTYMDRIRAIYRATPFTNLDQDPEYHDLEPHMRTTLEEMLREAGAGEDMRRALDWYNFYLCGLRSHETSIHLHAMVVGSFYHSALMFQRGGDSLVDAFTRRLALEGVDIYTGCAASGFEIGDQRMVRGVRVRDAAGEDDILECESCICTIHPKRFASLLEGGPARKGYLSRLRTLEETFSPFAVYLRIPSLPDSLSHANLYHLPMDRRGRETRASFVALACDSTGHGDGPAGICLLGRAWEGGDSGDCGGAAGGFCRQRENTGSGRYAAYKERTAEALLGNFLEHFPELQGRCSILSVATPCTYEFQTGTFGGSIYGAKHSVRQTRLNTITPVRHLFLAGQSVVAPGVMGAMVSGFAAAAQIVGWSTLWSEAKKWR